MEFSEIIDAIIGEYRETGVFKEYFEGQNFALFNDAFALMCREDAEKKALYSHGKKLYTMGVIPSTLLLIIAKIHTYLSPPLLAPFLINRHLLVKGYLLEKMLFDYRQLDRLIAESVGIRGKSGDNTAIAQLRWLKQWLDARINDGEDPDFDADCCEVGEWIHSSLHRFILDPQRRQGFVDDHRALHVVAKDAKTFYDKEEFLFALQLYLDLHNYTFRLREQFNFLFLREKFELYKIDPLTGLYNYSHLIDILQESRGDCFVILNVRHFSDINLLYGKRYGDEILNAIAAALRKYVKDGTLFHLYADEFAIISHHTICLNLIPLLSKMETDLERNSRIYARVSLYAAHGTIDETIFDRCRYVMMNRHDARQRIFDADPLSEKDTRRFSENIALSEKLKSAYADNRIVPYYQPVVSTQTKKIVGYEALMRVIGNDGIVMEPRDFLQVLKPMSIYPHFTRTLCKSVFETFEQRDEEFSINFTMNDLLNDETRLCLFSLFKQYPNAARRCTIELQENEVNSDDQQVSHFFNLLKQHDAKCALDNFGAGFSNFALLFHLPIDCIKIDGSIIGRLDEPKTMQLARTIIDMARTLHIQTVAEFVSDSHLFDLCREIGIDRVQGYFLGTPSPLRAP